mmetsp:Transcript_106192/g.265980  ORF Transcript_106192/g.265980 Transcript_106192/m.265980 type:complete len:300 (-) Transcript_106192:21-920(-)
MSQERFFFSCVAVASLQDAARSVALVLKPRHQACTQLSMTPKSDACGLAGRLAAQSGASKPCMSSRYLVHAVVFARLDSASELRHVACSFPLVAACVGFSITAQSSHLATRSRAPSTSSWFSACRTAVAFRIRCISSTMTDNVVIAVSDNCSVPFTTPTANFFTEARMRPKCPSCSNATLVRPLSLLDCARAPTAAVNSASNMRRWLPSSAERAPRANVLRERASIMWSRGSSRGRCKATDAAQTLELSLHMSTLAAVFPEVQWKQDPNTAKRRNKSSTSLDRAMAGLRMFACMHALRR